MKFNPANHHRHSIRLPGYDYTQPGAYFITICVKDRKSIFGEIINRSMQLNKYGIIVRDTWEWLAKQYPYVRLDEYVIMPNHFHGILWICDLPDYDGSHSCRRGGSRTAPTDMRTASMEMRTASMEMRTAQTDIQTAQTDIQTTQTEISTITTTETSSTKRDDCIKIKPVGRLIGAFKTVSTKHINILRNTTGAAMWQRDFYEHIGRNENDLYRIRRYIRNNPLNWDSDAENNYGRLRAVCLSAKDPAC